MTTKSSGHQTTDQLASKAHDAVDKAAKTAGHGEEYTREHVKDAEERLREATAHGRKRADEALGGVNRYVRDNPLMSMGIAFTAGALCSLLTRRR